MRPIDADALYQTEKLLDTNIVRRDKVASELLEQILYDIQHFPTLTPQNETPPCYQPDGDGCAYQCYDGDDEPIDKCKECPLCYSDKKRHITQQNEPLTIEQLRGMDKITPVWWTWNGCWCLCERGYITTPNGDVYGADEMNGLFYRRPLEGEVDGK